MAIIGTSKFSVRMKINTQHNAGSQNRGELYEIKMNYGEDQSGDD